MTRPLRPLPAFGLAATWLSLAFASGCDDMSNNPRQEVYEVSEFHADGRASRDPIPGTVFRGQLESERFDPASLPENQEYPFPITMNALRRGQERFNINCSMCHGRLGDGVGIVPSRGYTQPPSFHVDRLREVPPSYFVTVMTRGFGRMPDYAEQVPPEDRWAIAAYIRALQTSQNASFNRLSPQEQAMVRESETSPAGPANGVHEAPEQGPPETQRGAPPRDEDSPHPEHGASHDGAEEENR